MAVIERRRHSQGGRGAGAVPHRLREHRTRNVPLLESKLTAPAPRPASVPRPGLVNRLRVARAASVVLVHAPPGHGKTTLVADWARRDDRPFAWYRIDEGDDPHAFVTYLTAAVSRLCASTANGAKVPDADSEPEETAALLGHRLRSCGHSIVIVLDDVGLVQDERSIRLLARFVEELPTGSQLVLVSSSEPQLPVARLRAQRQLVELGPDDLRFSDREAGALMRNAGVDLANADVAALNDAVEGWAVALYLSALSFSSAGANAGAPAEVGAELLSEHFTGLLSELADDEIRFLTRTSVLDRLSGPLCDTVADAGDSAELLARLERAKCFVVPLDRVGDSYRVHRALRDVLAAELERREPGLGEILRSRAAGWYAAHDDLELALDHACSAGDRDQLVELVEGSALPFDSYARPGKVERWLDALDDDKLLAQHPAVAASGALTWAMAGHAEDAERWAAALRPRSARRSAHWQALLRCLMCPAGADEMRADANRALRGLSLDSAWRPAALFSLGVAHGLGGAFSTAQSVLREAAETAASVGAAGMESVVLGYHSMLATSLGEWTLADTLADSACRTVHDSHLDDRVTSLFAYAASARAALRCGDWATVHADLERARTLLPCLTYAIGTFSVLLRVEFARVYLALGDSEGALRLLDEVEEIFLHQPAPLAFRTDALAVRDQLEVQGHRVNGHAATLTAAELRLLPLLTTHLSFREIAEQLYVSRNTVKTQAISVYRKLGVSSRGKAIERASDLGLVADEILPEHAAG